MTRTETRIPATTGAAYELDRPDEVRHGERVLAATTGTDRIAVRYQLSHATNVRVDLVDILGRVIATLTNDARDQGAHTAWINTEALACGPYLCRLIAGDQTRTMRIMR